MGKLTHEIHEQTPAAASYYRHVTQKFHGNRIFISRMLNRNPKRLSAGVFNLDPELFCACRGERSRALGNPGARIVSNWFQQKTIKVFLIGLFKFERERLNVRRVWRVSGFFPRHAEVNTAGRFLISAIPKQHLND